MNTAAQYAKRKLTGLVNRLRVLFFGLSSHPAFKSMVERNFYKGAAETFFQDALDSAVARNAAGCYDVEKPGIAIYEFKGWDCPKFVNSAKTVVPADELPAYAKADCAIVFGHSADPGNVKTLAAAIAGNVPVVLAEDGFIKSADTWANRSAPERFRRSCSLVQDTKGLYYDAMVATDIECMLNNPEIKVSEKDCEQALRLIRKIVDNKITKYNHQPIFVPDVGRTGRRKVLVIDQSYGDFSIPRGWGSDDLFARMLEDAVKENPDADVLVKTHPDTMTGARKGYYDGLIDHDNVFRVTMPINPYSLMDVVDKVYVCSTQFGFEALMVGKEVHVYGMPFYAGWGITVDKQSNPRRTNRRSLPEIFHIFYVKYTHWMDPETGEKWTLDQAIDYMIRLRQEYDAFRKAAKA